MSTFDKIIGYDMIKEELLQICDMIHNKSFYDRLGAKLPSGVLLYGEPGLGKTLMAKCFTEECGLKTFTVRKTTDDDFGGRITATFSKAKNEAPSIVFLDDMDKFANEDDSHCNAAEYVSVQAGIDDVKGSGVFVIATVNDIGSLPDSLKRPGRFDKLIELGTPRSEDVVKIIDHYLKDKKIADDVSIDDLTKMTAFSSCAELETVINEAAIYAAYRRKKLIETEDIVRAVLRTQYGACDNFSDLPHEKVREIAVHEAGHIVMRELLHRGSVGLASINMNAERYGGGLVRSCIDMSDSENIFVSLAGKVSAELYFGSCDNGCGEDIARAYAIIRSEIERIGTRGLGFVSGNKWRFGEPSDSSKASVEAAVHAEFERYMIKTREALIKNCEFIQKAVEGLMAKGTLLASDISRIREDVAIVAVDLC